MLEFPVERAQANYRVTMLPHVYERALLAGHTDQNARALVQGRIAPGTEVELLRHSNVTSVVSFDQAARTITVGFDGSDEFGDRWDNTMFARFSHKLGGQVHGGYRSAILRQDAEGKKLADRLRERVAAFASKADGPVKLELAGMSRGGALATAFAAELLAEPDALPANVKLTSVITYGGLAYGDKEFNQSFAARLKEQGTEAWRVINGADTVPHLMTDKIWYTGKLFAHTGHEAYLLPGAGGTEVLVNPAPAELDTKLLLAAPGRNWHDTADYARSLGVPDAAPPEACPPGREMASEGGICWAERARAPRRVNPQGR